MSEVRVPAEIVTCFIYKVVDLRVRNTVQALHFSLIFVSFYLLFVFVIWFQCSDGSRLYIIFILFKGISKVLLRNTAFMKLT